MILSLRHIAAIGFATFCISTTGADYDATADGREIAAAVSDSRPRHYATDDEIAAVVEAYALDERGLFIDFFSEKRTTKFEDLCMLAIVPDSWWAICPVEYENHGRDLHNMLPAGQDVKQRRGDAPPGEVENIDYDNGTWQCGTKTIGDTETSLYQPPTKLRGDFARIYMYMALMYPATLQGGLGTLLYTDGGWPYLTAYGRELLLRWNEEDPVDDFELRRDKAIAAVQGNSNPFVAEPQLASLIWGGRLKGKYSQSTDKQLVLRSAYVSTDAEWAIDGVAVSGVTIDLNTLTVGRHELSYRTPRSRGRILIDIEP